MLFPIPQDVKIVYTCSKKVKDGFWCVACALDKHVITDKHVIRFLKNKQTPTHLGFRIPKKEPYRY